MGKASSKGLISTKVQNGPFYRRVPVRVPADRGKRAPLSGRAVSLSGLPKTSRGAILCRSGDEIEVHPGTFDAPDQLLPTYESQTQRREAWLPMFPLKHYSRVRPGTGRVDD